MRKLAGFTLSVLLMGTLLIGCGSGMSEEEAYNEAVRILRMELEDRGYYGLDFSSQALSTVEKMEGNVYVVKGSVFDGRYGYDFTVKMHVDKGDWVDYEWLVE